MGKGGPPSLQTYLLRREFWKQLGMRESDIMALPAREFEDFVLYMQLIHREEQERERRSASARS